MGQGRTVLRFAPNLAFRRVSTLTRGSADRIRRYRVTLRPPGSPKELGRSSVAGPHELAGSCPISGAGCVFEAETRTWLVALLVEHEIGVRRAPQELLDLAGPDATD